MFHYFYKIDIILVHLDCYNKIPHALNTTEIYFSQFWRLRSPSSRHQQIRCLVRLRFLGSQTALFSPCPHMLEVGRELSGVSFTRTVIPFTRDPHSSHNHFSKASSPNTITLGIMFQHINFGRTQIFSLQLTIRKKCKLFPTSSLTEYY